MRRESIERIQREKLAALLAVVRASNAFYQEKLGAAALDAPPGAKASTLKDLPLEDILDGIPFTTKEDLLEDQRLHPPFGSNLTFPLGRYTRIHQTSGTSGEPLWWLDTPESWAWVVRTWDEVFGAARVVAEDRFFFPFSFGPFLGFWAAFEGAARRGHLAIPGGG
ncbi:MAG TPA: phenylacetate--CoA ligase family protein, partial [Planctomycetota bacterium]|nr:phenylacetate--CoA ligase family protein [Planctomycetota bacterium]